MDQDSTKGSDKRNWRERLGIGTAGAPPAKDLPRISDEYEARNAKPQPVAPRPGSTRPATVRPAPMAPRPAGKSGPAVPVAPEKLAERLRSQREAQAKLAEQRVQVARQRSEHAPGAAERSVPPLQGSAPASAAAKPKFTFAEDEQGAAAAAASGQGFSPQAPKLTPARQPLGATPAATGFQPRATASPSGAQSPQQGQGTSLRPPFTPGGLTQPPLPGYRPFEQSIAPPPLPRTMPPGLGSGTSNGYAGQPRLGAPGRPGYGTGPDYPPFQSPQGAGGDPRFVPAQAGRTPLPPQRATAPQFEDGLPEDAYYPEQMPQSRAGRRSAADYRQAYHDMEQGYEDEAPRSRGPWILLAMLVMTLGFAMAGVWYYQTYFKPTMSATTSNAQVPVVQPPAGETVAQPEQSVAEPAAAPAGKRIYDRIVGEREVLSGQLAPAEEVPLETPAASGQLPEPEVQPVVPGAAGADDAAPLPIPPPPGDGNTQGSLPAEPATQATALSDPAAGDSQAAIVPQTAAATPPAPGETVEPVAAEANEQPALAETTETTETAEAVEPVVPPVKKPPAVAKKIAAKQTESLGVAPVVLVPPATPPATIAQQNAGTAPGSLYGEEGAVASTAPVATQPAVKKKKKTLADLFNNTAGDTTQLAQNPEPALVAQPAPTPPQPQAQQKQVQPAPAETQVAAAAGYVAQLASFRTRQEATTEFGRLKTRHGAILQGATPIINEATVAGSTRYRLAVGGFASREQASALCSKLIAAGERDCLVKLQ